MYNLSQYINYIQNQKGEYSMKKTICIILAVLLLAAHISYAEYELPHAFWALNDAYAAAVESKNYPEIKEYASQIISLLEDEPKNEQVSNIIGSRSYEAGFACYFLKDYDNAVKYFNIYLPYGEKQGWSDGVKIASDFIKQLSSSLDIYKYTDEEQVYFGAKNEPHGVLYGQVSEKATQNESMILLYLEYGDTYFDWANAVMKRAREENKTVELALNFPNEASDVKNLNANDSFLTTLIDFLSRYKDVKIMLRIGAEMNIWNNFATPEEYINAFRIIALKMRPLNNVATVWSCAHTSTWPSESRPYRSYDYYPGDEYVDWVGVNAYPTKYFNGQKYTGKDVFNEICFKSGYSADPVLMVKEIVDLYGSKKPVMICECGSAYKTNGSVNEYHHEWGAAYLDQIYSFLPMVYPQIKLIAYFNKNIPYELNYYDLGGSPALFAAYEDAVRSPWFIQNSNTNHAETYFEKIDSLIFADDSITVGAYPHLFGSDSITVEYYIDSELAAASYAPPYRADFLNLSGYHKLKVVAKGNNGSIIEKNYEINPNDKPAFNDTSSLDSVQLSATDWCVKKGIVQGYEDGGIHPYDSVTRAEFAALIYRMMNYTDMGECSFDDARYHWASKYINACVLSGAINGVGDNKFEPDETVTFEQALKIVTIVRKVATGSESYPEGYISVAQANGLLENLMSAKLYFPLSRIDAFMIMYQSDKN